MEKRTLAYPYYAGFSQGFVEAVFDNAKLDQASMVMDPWNGSGTTTHAAALRGIAAVGYDINPALVVVARARSAKLQIHEAVNAAWGRCDFTGENSIEAASPVEIAAHVFRIVVAESGRKIGLSERSVLLSALFEALRRNFKHAKSKNPSWFKSRAGEGPIGEAAPFIRDVVDSLNRALAKKREATRSPMARPVLHATNFLAARPPPLSVDLVVTSPPYLTRIDYVKATLPELLLLQRLGGVDPTSLRRLMTGTPLVGSIDSTPTPSWGPTANNLIGLIAAHPSKASNAYYRRFFANYFRQLSQSVGKVSASLKSGGLACLVVQTSYYKEIFVDLPLVVAEMGQMAGLHTEAVIAFETNRSMVNVNSRALGPVDKRVESAVLMRKPT